MDPAPGNDRENLAAAMKPRERTSIIMHRGEGMNVLDEDSSVSVVADREFYAWPSAAAH